MPKMIIEIDAPEFNDPDELRQAVIDEYVRRELAAFGIRHGDHPDRQEIRVRVDEIVQATVRARIDAAVDDITSKPFILTNRYGEPQAAPQTLREYVMKTAESWFDARVAPNGEPTSYSGVPRGQWLALKAAESVYKDVLAASMTQIKDQIAASIRSRVHTEIADTVVRLLAPK